MRNSTLIPRRVFLVFGFVLQFLVSSGGASSATSGLTGKLVFVFAGEMRVYDLTSNKALFTYRSPKGVVIYASAAATGPIILIEQDAVQARLIQLDSNGKAVKTLAVSRPYDVDTLNEALLSPDGRLVVYKGECKLKGCPSDSGIVVQDTQTGQLKAFYDDFTLHPRQWLTDGRLLFAKNLGEAGIFVSAPDGVKPLQDVKLSLATPKPRDPRISPDGKKIAYAWNDRVWVADFDGRQISNPRQVTNGKIQEGVGAWSPDSKWLMAVSRIGGLDFGELLLVSPNGKSDPVTILDSGTSKSIKSEFPLYEGNRVMVCWIP